MSTKNRTVLHIEDSRATLESVLMVDMSLIAGVVAENTKLDCLKALSFLLGYFVPEAAAGNTEAVYVLQQFAIRYPRFRDAISINVPNLFSGQSFREH